MSTNPLAISVIAKTDQLTAGLAKASAELDTFSAGVNKASDTQAAQAGERALRMAAQTTAQTWVSSRMAMIQAEERANAALKAGRKANAASLQETLAELDARHDAFLAASRRYYEGMTTQQQEAYAAQEAAANKQIETEYQRLAARLDATAGVEADSDALTVNTAALTFNSQAQREASYAIGELATGRYGRLETSMLSLTARTGLMAQVMSPLGAAIGVAAGSVVLLSAALLESERNAERFNRAILSTGGAIGVTTDQLEGMAHSLATDDVTIGQASQALLALAQSGRFSGDTLEQAGQAAADFAQLTGESIKQATAAVERLATDPAKAVAKLDEQYHFLSLAQFEHIQQLQQEGDETGAATAAVDAFAQAMHRRAQAAVRDESVIVKGWSQIKQIFEAPFHARVATSEIDRQIASIKEQLAPQERSIANPSGGISAARRAYLESQLKALELQKKQEEQSAKQRAAQDKLTAAAIQAEAAYDKQAAALKVGNAAAEARLKIIREIEAIHRANPHDARLKGDVFDAAGNVTHLNSTASAITAHAQRQLDAHPLHLPIESAAGAEATLRHAEQALQRFASQQRELASANASTEAAINQLRVQGIKRVLDAAVAAGHMSAQERLAIEKRLTEAEYTEDVKRLNDELALLTPGTAAYQQVADQIELIQAQHYQKLGALRTQYNATKRAEAAAELAERRRHIAQIESMENQLMSGLISGRMSWAQAERSIVQRLAAAELEAVMHAITEKLALREAEAAKTIAIKTATGLKAIAIDAYEAAASAFKAMVGVPYIGPVLGAAAAAAALIEVKSFARFDVGAFNVPRDMAAIVHSGEMVLPRPFAEEARSRGFLGGGERRGIGGPVHLHLHTPDVDSTRDFLLNNSEAVADAVRQAVREGSLP